MTFRSLSVILWFFFMNGILQFAKHLEHTIQGLGVSVGFQAGRPMLDVGNDRASTLFNKHIK